MTPKKKIEKKSWKDFRKWRVEQLEAITVSGVWQEYDKKINFLIKDMKVKMVKKKFLFWEWDEKETDYFVRAMSISNQITFLTSQKLALFNLVPKETYENYLTWKNGD